MDRLFFRVLFVVLVFGNCRSATVLPENTDFGTCTCNLQASSCDTNCCCDTDCTAEEIKSFSGCLDSPTRISSQSCSYTTRRLTSNLVYEYYTVQSSNIFCIYRDNYNSRNFYSNPSLLTTASEIDAAVANNKAYSFATPASSSNTYTNYYKSGDPIYTYTASNYTGQLFSPKSIVTQYCDDFNKAAFLQSETASCSRQITNLATECQSLAALSAATYIGQFKVARTPSLFRNELVNPGSINSTDPTVDYTDPNLITPSLGTVTCLDTSGNSVTCPAGSPPTPSYASLVCSNVVKKVSYDIVYNITTGIDSVDITFTLGPLSSVTSFQQTFAISYAPLTSSDTFPRSGNPGYIKGKPLLAGNLISGQYIRVKSDSRDWWTIAAGGQCSNTLSKRQPVLFGINLRTGCSLSITSTVSSRCTALQMEVYTILRGISPPDRVGTWGNTNTSRPADWIPIFETGYTAQPTTSIYRCENAIVGVNIDVLYARVGSASEPQMKVIGTKMNYIRGNIQFQCGGSYCLPGSESLTQSVEITTTVNFLDASATSVQAEKAIPIFLARLPYDFFYPFFVTSSASLPALQSLISTMMMVIMALSLVRFDML